MTRLVLAVAILVASTATAQDVPKPRLYVTDSVSWEMTGAFVGSEGKVGGFSSGGARPQTAELVRTFGEKCSAVTVTMKRDAADYVLLFDREGGKGAARKDNKFALFQRDGDAVGSGSTRTLGNAVKDACAALLKDWKVRPR